MPPSLSTKASTYTTQQVLPGTRQRAFRFRPGSAVQMGRPERRRDGERMLIINQASMPELVGDSQWTPQQQQFLHLIRRATSLRRSKGMWLSANKATTPRRSRQPRPEPAEVVTDMQNYLGNQNHPRIQQGYCLQVLPACCLTCPWCSQPAASPAPGAPKRLFSRACASSMPQPSPPRPCMPQLPTKT